MNRQVVPSMILSVVIVCFFSILLYENDDPRAVAERDRPGMGRIPGPLSSSRSAVKSSSLRPARSLEPGGRGRRASAPPTRRGTKVDPSGQQATSSGAETSDNQGGVLTQAAARQADPGGSGSTADSLPETAPRRVIVPRETEEPR